MEDENIWNTDEDTNTTPDPLLIINKSTITKGNKYHKWRNLQRQLQSHGNGNCLIKYFI